jgi:hypothetical protein
MADTHSPQAGYDMRSNLWWLIAAVGIGLLALAYVISFFSNFDSIRDKDKAAAVFRLLGYLAVTAGLTLGSLLMTSLSWGARIALMLGAVYINMAGIALLGLAGLSGIFG